MGVGAPDGAETAELAEDEKSTHLSTVPVTITVNMATSFNSIDRAAMLAALRGAPHHVLPFAAGYLRVCTGAEEQPPQTVRRAVWMKCCSEGNDRQLKRIMRWSA